MVAATSAEPAYFTTTWMPVSSVKASMMGWTRSSVRPQYREMDASSDDDDEHADATMAATSTTSAMRFMTICSFSRSIWCA